MTNDTDTAPRILVLDDETAQCRILVESLHEWGFDSIPAQTAHHALDLLDSAPFDMVVSDVKMPGMDGLEFVRRIRHAYPTLPALLITAFPDIRQAVDAVKDGALDYLVKPIDLDELRDLVKNAIGREIPRSDDLPPLPQEFVFTSLRIKTLLRDAYLVAKADIPILLTGESGTGKEVFADLIHSWSVRSEAPFLKLSCAALPEAMVESELFGHVRGAFTGAASARQGQWKASDGGTLLLDEIGELAPALQAKLLRALQDGSYRPVGADAARKADVRIIASTNRDMESAVEKGEFREDLYYRLNAVELMIPPLRERPEDIRPLAENALKKAEGSRRRLSPPTIKMLETHPWPGNIRELRNEIKRADLMARGGVILPEHLSSRLRRSVTGGNEPRGERPIRDYAGPMPTLAEIEKQDLLPRNRQFSWKECIEWAGHHTDQRGSSVYTWARDHRVSRGNVPSFS